MKTTGAQPADDRKKRLFKFVATEITGNSDTIIFRYGELAFAENGKVHSRFNPRLMDRPGLIRNLSGAAQVNSAKPIGGCIYRAIADNQGQVRINSKMDAGCRVYEA